MDNIFSTYLTQLKYLIPELTILGASIIAMFVHLFMPKKGHRVAGIICLIGLVAGLAVLLTPSLSPVNNDSELFSGNIKADSFSYFLKGIFMLAGILTIFLSFRFFDVEGSEAGEIYYLLLMGIIGMMVAVSSVDLVSFYVAFELFAIISYILAGIFKKEKRSAEAGIKYFILGSLSSAIMMLGVALVVGLTGKTNYAELGKMLSNPAIIADANHKLALMGMVLFFIGMFFKLALVPFHMWTPDVYEGAPTPLVAFLSTAPKAAVFAIMIRVLMSVFPHFEFQTNFILQGIAIVTMFWGNIAALIQNNIKRMMAYSSIAHAGYIVIGLAAMNGTGHKAVLFYLFAYLFMNVAAFGLILLVQKNTGFGEQIDDMRGMAKRSPWIAASVIVLLLSLTGIPPTVGFIGKYYLFAAAVEKGMYILAVAGALNSVISLFYYFRIGRAMFMEEPVGEISIDKTYAKYIFIIACLVIFLLGIYPAPLTNIVLNALP